MANHGQVVGNKEIGQVLILLHILHQIQNLGLNGHIQSRNRLVTYNESRIQRQGPGDPDALAASAVQLVGLAVGQPLRQPHCIHQLQHLLLPLPG